MRVGRFLTDLKAETKMNRRQIINIDAELSLLRKLNLEKEKIKSKNTGNIAKDVFDKIHSKEYSELIDKDLQIEKIIKDKLWDTMIKYCEKGDYEGAKRFVGKSYKDMNTSGKVLLFRSILVHQEQNKK